MAKRKTAKPSKKQRIVAPVGKQRRADIKALSEYFPSVAKLKGKRGLTAGELGQLTRAKNAIRGQHTLVAVTDKQYKELKKKGLVDADLSKKGIRAVRLRNVQPGSKVKVLKDGTIKTTSGGRKWEYHASQADIDSVGYLGLELLDRADVWAVYLWTNKGRVGEGFADPNAWTEWLYDRYQRYQDADEFVKGVACVLKPSAEKTTKKRA
jgi:hypothetical protein